MPFYHSRHRMPLAGLQFHQERVLCVRQIKPGAQISLNARQERGGNFGIGHRAVRPARAGQAVKRGHCAQLVARCLGLNLENWGLRDSSTVHANGCGAGNPARASSAVQ